MALLGQEFRDKRSALGLSQQQIASAVNIGRATYTRIEAGRMRNLSIKLASQIASVSGLDLVVRTYPGATPLRDAAHAERLSRVMANVRPPLSYALEAPLPKQPGQPFEQRAWDAMVSGSGKRTGFEMEMRVRDGQALERRIALKRRDDPVDGVVLLLADTNANRRLLRDNPLLFPDLARLRLAALTRMLRDGQHPPGSVVFV